MSRPRGLGILAGLGLALLCLMVLATALGSVAVPLPQTIRVLAGAVGLGSPGEDALKWEAIILLIRLPRVLGAALIGAVLAVAGTVMQGVLRNPMADPGIIGVSGGAGFGAVLVIASGLAAQSPWFTPLGAALGALAAAGFIFALASGSGSRAVFTLILAGIAVSTFFGAGTSLVLTFASRDSVAQFIFWSMGNLTNLRWESLAVVAGPLGLCLLVLLASARELNVFLLGESNAQSLGMAVPRVRLVLLVTVALGTAAAVSASGPIGFVGLIVPHMLRLVVGPDNRILLPASALGGGLFLVGCDLVARLAAGAQEINVGTVTALLGAPYFLFLLVRAGRKELTR